MKFVVTYYYSLAEVEDRVTKFFFNRGRVYTVAEILEARDRSSARKKALTRAHENMVDTGKYGIPYHKLQYIFVAEYKEGE